MEAPAPREIETTVALPRLVAAASASGSLTWNSHEDARSPHAVSQGERASRRVVSSVQLQLTLLAHPADAPSLSTGIRPAASATASSRSRRLLTLRLGRSPAGSRDRREMALEVERTPAIPDLLYTRGLPGPNRSGGRGTVYASGLPESAPKTNLPLEQVYHTSSGEARAEARQARLTTGALPCQL